MPKGGKGGSRNRSAKKAERYPVPITVQFAIKLKLVAKGRADDAPLLVQGDGSPWGSNPGQRYHREMNKVVVAIGLDPDEVTMVLPAPLQHRACTLAQRSDQTSGLASQHQRCNDRTHLFEIHHRAQRRYLAPRTAAA